MKISLGIWKTYIHIVSNTTEKRPKNLGAMKYNWKLMFSSHQGTQKRDPLNLILTLWQNDSERLSGIFYFTIDLTTLMTCARALN